LRKHIEQYNKTDKFFVVGYNIRTFDEPVLRRWFSQNGSKWYGSFFWNPSIDVMDIAAYTLMNHRHELENFRLPTVARYLGIEFNEEEAHDGLYDARITREMYYNLIGEEMK
jgi:DNA polymerase-3 subunit epsilon